jgi:shikimate dehydrogenase
MSVAVTTRLWLVGEGIEHSPSPAMHNAALRALGLDWKYSLRDVPGASLGDVLAELRAGVAAGCNVTIPHKRAVADACDSLSGDALPTGAVNTVVVRDGALVGHNTDAEGFRLALEFAGLTPAPGSNVIVFGAGGAARAVVLAMQRCGVEAIAVAARSGNPSVSGIPVLPWDAGAIRQALSAAVPTTLVNATPAGLEGLPLNVAALPSTTTVIDLRYRYGEGDLIPTALARNLRAADGREMLLQQAMLSLQLWTGLTPPHDAARAALDHALAA